MLKTITTNNFRQLTNRTFDMTAGLNVVRGANEAGKSTLLEAIAFALGGVKACRSPLEDLVTWGQLEKTLKVTVVMEFEKIDYTITRSKSGAEINYMGGKVVGQKECTAFIERMLGAGGGMMGRLMLASQGAIRGALEEGPKATMELIEKLANFDVLDTVIELVQTKLSTGPTATQEDRVARAQEALHTAKATITAPDTDTLTSRVAVLSGQIDAEQASLALIAPTKKAAQDAAVLCRDLASKREMLQGQLVSLFTNRESKMAQLKVAEKTALTMPAAAELKAAEHLAAEAAQIDARRAAHTKMRAVMATYPAVSWDKDIADLRQASDVNIRLLADLHADRNAVVLKRTAAQAHLNVSHTCPSCNRPYENAEETRKHHLAAVTVVADCALEINQLDIAIAEAEAERAAMALIQQQSTKFERAATELGDNVVVEWNCVPPSLSWKGDLPAEVDNSVELQAIIAGLTKRTSEANRALASMKVLTEAIVHDDRSIAEAERQIAECSGADNLPNALAELEAIYAQYNLHANALLEMSTEKQNVLRELATAQDTFKRQAEAAATAKDALDRELAELAKLEFNNALLKRVRAARPIIADKLWTIVLSAVSGYFSAMRGTKSVVTRASNEFKVDGQAITGLSGSTLDILGLAIRLALTRTFLPSSPFLILEEPAAAMDDTRTAATLGFLAAAGFQQTLLVTHEELSESVANNLITI